MNNYNPISYNNDYNNNYKRGDTNIYDRNDKNDSNYSNYSRFEGSM